MLFLHMVIDDQFVLLNQEISKQISFYKINSFGKFTWSTLTESFADVS